MVSKPELLAPAGGWESMVAAIQNGADAVYMGGKDFSARKSASNFDREELARAVEYAHIRGVKVYVTVNTLILNNEIEAAADFLRFLYNTGVDAVIVQDLGVIRMASIVVPELELHASTQMTVHNTAAAKILRKAGIRRIVLARELSLMEIKEIKEQAGVEVEVFIHGALCISYSGQCLMSSMIGGRSGNRGRCAQPCRMQYKLENDNGNLLVFPEKPGEYILSPRDLNISEHLPALIDAGIHSFKIEGRMKKPEYVATVTRIYRTLIDRALEGNFYITEEEKYSLTQIFNRDFTTGYFIENPRRNLMSYKRPNNRGVLVGRVKIYDKKQQLAKIKLETPLRIGDGIEIWVSRGGRAASELHRLILKGKSVEYADAGEIVQVEIKGDIRPGDRVFKTHDSMLMEKARSTFTSDRETRKIPVCFSVNISVGKPMHVTVQDIDGNTGKAISDAFGEKALKRPLTREIILKQLDRLGNTPYSLKKLYCNIDGQVILPLSEINEVRRKTLSELSNKRLRVREKSAIPRHTFLERLNLSFKQPVLDLGKKENPLLIVTVSDLKSLQEAIQSGAKNFYLKEFLNSKAKLDLQVIEKAIEICNKKDVKLILSTPRIIHNMYFEQYMSFLENVFSLPLDGILVSNLGVFDQVRSMTSIPIYTDFHLNVANSQSVAFLIEKRAQRITLSPELTMKQIKDINSKCNFPLEVLVHGVLPLMVSRHCILGSLLGERAQKVCSKPCLKYRARLKDRKGISFPIGVDAYCNMHIFNSRDLCLIDNLDEIIDAGVSSLRIDACLYTPENTGAIVKIYMEAMNRYFSNQYTREFSVKAKNELLEYTKGGFTKGHYFRGIN